MPRRNRVAHQRPGRGLSSRSKAARNFAKREHEREEKAAAGGNRRKPAARTVRCPTGKVGMTREVAARQLHEHQRTDVTTNRTSPVRTYLCPRCDAWHLTSQPWRGPRQDPPAAELGETG